MRLAALALVSVLAIGAVGRPPVDPAAKLSKSDSASEYWDFVAAFPTGHRVASRFLITNEGPGKHTAVSVGHVVFPDGSVKAFRNGRREGSWEIEPDGQHIHIGSSRLNLRDGSRWIEIDNDKRGVKIRLEFGAATEFEAATEADPAQDAAVATGSGFGPGSGPEGWTLDLIDLDVPVSGSLWVEGMKAPDAVEGRASLTHTAIERSESSVTLRRFDFTSLGEDAAVSFWDLTTPSGKRAHWLVLARNGRILYESSDLEVSLEGAAPGWSERDYPVPARLRFQNSSVSGTVDFERVWLHHDPSEDLPQPFRFLLSFRTRPRRVWADSPFQLKFNSGSDRSSMSIDGTGVTSVTWMNPLAAAAQTPPPGSGA